jgi:hypothetical protein
MSREGFVLQSLRRSPPLILTIRSGEDCPEDSPGTNNRLQFGRERGISSFTGNVTVMPGNGGSWFVDHISKSLLIFLGLLME